MISLEINGVDDVLRVLQTVQRQIPYATSRALNTLAKEIQTRETTRELPDHLKLRGPWWRPGTRFGVNISFATKTNLEARVGSAANWLVLQEQGGTKTPPRTALAIPTDNINRDVRRSTRLKPSVLLRERGAFIKQSRTGVSVLVVPTGRGKTKLKALYYFKPRARVPRRIHFVDAGEQVARSRYLEVFSDELANAIRTAR